GCPSATLPSLHATNRRCLVKRLLRTCLVPAIRSRVAFRAATAPVAALTKEPPMKGKGLFPRVFSRGKDKDTWLAMDKQTPVQLLQELEEWGVPGSDHLRQRMNEMAEEQDKKRYDRLVLNFPQLAQEIKAAHDRATYDRSLAPKLKKQGQPGGTISTDSTPS